MTQAGTLTNSLTVSISVFYNDLDDESSDEEIKPVLQALQAELKKVKIGYISLPMTSSESDAIIEGL